MEIENKINVDIDELVETKSEICTTIDTVQDDTLKLLLQYRYIVRKAVTKEFDK